MKTIIASVIIALAATGCATPEQIAAANQRNHEEQVAENERAINLWTDRCEGYGQSRGTSGMASCVQSEAQAWQNRNQQAQAINEANRQNSIRANLCAMGNREWCGAPQIRTVCNRDLRGALVCNSQ